MMRYQIVPVDARVRPQLDSVVAECATEAEAKALAMRHSAEYACGVAIVDNATGFVDVGWGWTTPDGIDEQVRQNLPKEVTP